MDLRTLALLAIPLLAPSIWARAGSPKHRDDKEDIAEMVAKVIKTEKIKQKIDAKISEELLRSSIPSVLASGHQNLNRVADTVADTVAVGAAPVKEYIDLNPVLALLGRRHRYRH